MKANHRFLIILLGLFIALAAALAMQERTSNTTAIKAPPTPQLQRIFPDLAVLDILAMRIEDRLTGEAFTLARDSNGTWLGQRPDQATTYTLREDSGTLLARSVVLMGFVQTIPLTAERNLAEFGFRPDGQLYIAIVTVNDRQHVVAVGDPLQTGPYYYVIVDERPEIYVVDRAAIDNLASALDAPPFLATP